MWAWLATLGLGCGSAYQEVPAWLVASTRTPFPLHSHRTTILDAVDGDPATAWHAEAGEIGTFYAAGNHVEAVRIHGDADTVEVRTFRSGVWGAHPVGAWVRRTVVRGQVVEMAGADRAVEIRFPRDTKVASVTLLSSMPGQPRQMEWMKFLGQYNGSGDLMDYDSVRFGKVDLARCSLEAPGDMPDGAYVGEVECSEDSFRVDASNPYRAHVRGRFDVEALGPCLRMVDGWPMAVCR